MKQATMRDVVKQLRQEGHSVTYYVRKDGGILIKTIDGQRFTGATGNMYARAMSGETLSVKRAEQLTRITWSGKRAKSYIEDREVKRLLQRVQRKWNQAFPHKRGEIPPVGLKTSKKVKWSLENRGREETIRLLTEAERYASGKAYSENIRQLADYVEDAALKYESEELQELANSIRDNAWMILEESIKPAYDELYLLNKGHDPREIAKNVKKILRIP